MSHALTVCASLANCLKTYGIIHSQHQHVESQIIGILNPLEVHIILIIEIQGLRDSRGLFISKYYLLDFLHLGIA